MPHLKPQAHQEFEREMLPYIDMLYTYATYLTGDKERAGDLLQDTYLKAYKYFRKFEQGTNAKAWLYRIMRNTFINEYRRRQRLPETVQYDEQISSYGMSEMLSTTADDIVAAADSDIFGDEVSEAMAALPEKFKTIVVLRDVQDLAYEEIAEALRIPIGTVRSRLHRARAMLFARLKGYARENGFPAGKDYARELALAR